MSVARVLTVVPGSPAERADLRSGDEIVAVDGCRPRDVLEYQRLVDEPHVEIDVRRGGLDLTLEVDKAPGAPIGAELESALFDRVRTCDNHCEFCFIHQLPKGMRRSLYQMDDDYRLSFLYGNFTTLTRFTEVDLERCVTEGLSPLHVSIHATDPEVRAAMLRNPRGATSLRWLRALLDHSIEVHGQVVVCPGINDGAILDDTMAGVLDRYPDLASVGVVPLGVSRFNGEATMRPHQPQEAAQVLDIIGRWQSMFRQAIGRRMVFASDELYLMAGRPTPPLEHYEGCPQHENGIGIAAAFEAGFTGRRDEEFAPNPGFFAWVDGAPASGYRAPRRSEGTETAVEIGRRRPVTILTGEYAGPLLSPLVHSVDPDAVVVEVRNEFFGGNIAVAGLMVAADLARVLTGADSGRRYLLPDVCLSGGRFLDGAAVADLPVRVEVVPTDGAALRAALR